MTIAAGMSLVFGVAVQNICYYTCLFLVPLFLLNEKRAQKPVENIRFFLQLAAAFAVIFLVFPLANLIDYFTLEVPAGLALRKLFTSKVSTGVSGTGIAMLVYAWRVRYFRRDRVETLRPKFPDYSRGLLLGFIILTMTCLLQHFYGIDFIKKGWNVTQDDLMGEGIFRAQGFYGHQLTLASVGLAVFAYYFSLLLQLQAPSPENLDEFLDMVPTCVGLCILSLAVILLSGSRTTAALIPVAAILPASFVFRKFDRSLRLRLVMAMILLLLSLVGAAYLTGLHNRILREVNAAHSWQDIFANRVVFWQVHWQMFLDHPWWGLGFTLVDQFFRQDYYTRLGYAHFGQHYHAHNVYLETLVSCGIFGAAIIIAAVVYLIKLMRKWTTHNSAGKMQLRALFVAILMNALHGLTQNTFFDASLTYIYLSFFAILFWQILGKTLPPCDD